MSANRALFTNNSDEWETPQDLFDDLNNEFHFTLDACASAENRKVEKYYDLVSDGLKNSWGAVRVLQSPVFTNQQVG